MALRFARPAPRAHRNAKGPAITPTKPTPQKNLLKHLRASDLRGVARLGTEATSAVAHITEGVHRSVLGSLSAGAAPGRTRGITGFVYQCVQGVTRWVGQGLDAALAGLQPLFDKIDAERPGTPEREAVLAVLCGVMGDHLQASANPLATPMSLRRDGELLDAGALPMAWAGSGKLVLFIHGLCMNDLQWRPDPASPELGSDHARALVSELGYTALDLRYNSGLHVSQNGRALAALLEALAAQSPGRLQEISIVAHSMGGLVARSAIHIASEQAMQWPGLLKHLVFLGTPHHGAPLERAGHWIDLILGATPYSAPLAKLGQLRSAGITDLRHGLVRDEDWQGRDRFARHGDGRRPLALPAGVHCCAVAATLGGRRDELADRLLGDGLVPLRSALGEHARANHRLGFAADSTFILHNAGHLDLLHHPDVSRQLLGWMAAR